MEIRVMSFNIRNSSANDGAHAWPKRRNVALDVIRAYHPDLIGFQEVLADQHDDILSRMSDYTFAGVARDDGLRKGEWALIGFRTDRFELIESGNFWLSEEPQTIRKGWDAAHVRICSWVKLQDTQAKRALLFANTHWDNEGIIARKMSSILIKRTIFELAQDMPAILTGDFNSHESQEWVQQLLRAETGSVQFLDSYREIHPQRDPNETTYHGFGDVIEGSRIDYILHSAGLRAVDADIVRTRGPEGLYPTDHFPVTACLSWNE